MGLWIIPGLVLLAVVLMIGIYNSLVRLRNRVKNGWSQIAVQLKRRHDLIPNLVKTVSGYAQHERGVLENVTRMRNMAKDATEIPEQILAEGRLSGALGRLLAVVENYPDLKADGRFQALQEELSSTENRISFARQAYNDQVLALNNRIEMFPSNLVAAVFHFTPAEYFGINEPGDDAVPEVQLGPNE